VQENPDGMLDLWAREHYKSTIITFAKSIQDILSSHGDDPLPEWGGIEVTIGIFSHTRPIAKGFLRQIKREFEDNDLLKEWFPDILWKNPRAESPGWSEDAGIIVKRKSNPKEATVEAHGLVDGQPTSKHFWILNYDDVVTRESVTTPDMIKKTTAAWELSTNLGSDGGKERIIGTRYHFNDTYADIIKRKAAIPRIHPATENGEADGVPVLLSRERLVDKRTKQGPYTFGCQMLQNPKSDSSQGFQEDWIKLWDAVSYQGLNIYLLRDPASEKKKSSDYTVDIVVGLGQDKNYYIIDIERSRLNLTERTSQLFNLHSEYEPLDVGYEQYGMQADIEHVEEKQREMNYRFNINKVGGSMPKNDRIKRLIPLFEQGRIFFPKRLLKTDERNIKRDIVREFIDDEYLAFPVGVHDDMLDCLARIFDIDTSFPKAKKKVNIAQPAPAGWMGM